MNKSNKDISEIYDRDNVALFAILKHKLKEDVCFIVVSTHLLFNTNRGDVKLGQTYQIIKTLELLKSKYKSQFSKISLIFSGDFNAIPNSGIYKFITKGSLDCSDIDRRKVIISYIILDFWTKPNKIKFYQKS
jgi:mRNA deadenylase 3'-5' endonuclease subunit Ccr4